MGNTYRETSASIVAIRIGSHRPETDAHHADRGKCEPFFHRAEHFAEGAGSVHLRAPAQGASSGLASSGIWLALNTHAAEFSRTRNDGSTPTSSGQGPSPSVCNEVVLMSARDNEQPRGRGFASMDQEKQKMIASQGGRAAHEQGTAHEFSSEEARAAGRKGGEAVSANRAHMAAIGRKGGEASHRGSAGRRAVQEAHSATPHANSAIRTGEQNIGQGQAEV